MLYILVYITFTMNYSILSLNSVKLMNRCLGEFLAAFQEMGEPKQLGLGLGK